MPKPKRIKRHRINITMPPVLLRKVDAAAGPFQRSAYIEKACGEKLDKDGKK